MKNGAWTSRGHIAVLFFGSTGHMLCFSGDPRAGVASLSFFNGSFSQQSITFRTACTLWYSKHRRVRNISKFVYTCTLKVDFAIFLNTVSGMFHIFRDVSYLSYTMLHLYNTFLYIDVFFRDVSDFETPGTLFFPKIHRFVKFRFFPAQIKQQNFLSNQSSDLRKFHDFLWSFPSILSME